MAMKVTPYDLDEEDEYDREFEGEIIGPDDDDEDNPVTVFVRELVVYLVFLVVFTSVVFITRQPAANFEYKELWQQTVTASLGSSFRTQEHFWNFMRVTFVKVLQTDVDKPLYGHGFGSKLVGAARIRQLRVSKQPCPKTEILLQNHFKSLCYPEWASWNEEVDYLPTMGTTIIDSSKDWYQWKSASDLGEPTFVADIMTYSGGGFAFDVHNATEATTFLATLQGNDWVDLGTRAVFADVVFYHPNVDLFLISRQVFEFLPSGAVRPTVAMHALSLNIYPLDTTVSYISTALECILGALTVWYLGEEGSELYKLGVKEYSMKFWNVIDLVNLVVLGAFFVVRVLLHLNAEKILATDPGQLVSSQFMGINAYYQLEGNLIGVNGLLIWLRLFKYLKAVPYLATLVDVFERGMRQASLFIVLFIITTVAWSVFGFVSFGNGVRSYMSFPRAFSSLLSALFGQFDYAAMENANSALAGPFLFSYCFTAGFIMLGLMASIFVQANGGGGGGGGGSEPLSVQFQRMREQKAAQASKGASAMAKLQAGLGGNGDANADGRLDKTELETILANSGAAAIMSSAPADLLAKYDKDGSGDLDGAELAGLQAEVAERQAQLQAMASGGGGVRASAGEGIGLLDSDPVGNSVPGAVNRQVDRIERQLFKVTQSMTSMSEQVEFIAANNREMMSTVKASRAVYTSGMAGSSAGGLGLVTPGVGGGLGDRPGTVGSLDGGIDRGLESRGSADGVAAKVRKKLTGKFNSPKLVVE